MRSSAISRRRRRLRGRTTDEVIPKHVPHRPRAGTLEHKGGGAAVLLQVAHPLVACGVVDHSGYDRDLWRRLARTLQALYLISFGDRQEAERAGAAVQAVHARVHGRTTEQLGPFPPGTTYSATDPQLMRWVHATLDWFL